MARIFITGSSDGLGFLAGKALIDQGHEVVLHARNAQRAQATKERLPKCRDIVVGDVSTLAVIKNIAHQINAMGPFDAVIHNVGLGDREARVETEDGVTQIFAVNVLTPYVLTALITPPERLIYLGSDMHARGDPGLDDPQWQTRRWDSYAAYSDTKLYDVTLAMYLARQWPGKFINAVDPGWVPTRMGGATAPDDLAQGAATQAWLAVSDDPAAKVTGRYLYHKKPQRMNPVAAREDVQARLVEYLRGVTGVELG
ncbi:MAG: SDR family NAD(P)-dependent oxidoreductase [Burkholderiaceae bacterium]|nr:MAG: SDR family NAD(P)-dependent oxidoreductase [Burkholderiaceae bacterium]